MSPHCSICNHDRQAHVDRLVLHGRSLLSISRECGVSYDALRRHVASGHVTGWPLARARPSPAAVPAAAPAPPAWESGHDGRGRPGEVWEFSEEEDAAWEAAVGDWLGIVASVTGLGAAALRACWDGVSDPAGRCATCDATNDDLGAGKAAYAVLDAIAGYRDFVAPPAPGRWVSVEELEAEARDGRAPGAAAR